MSIEIEKKYRLTGPQRSDVIAALEEIGATFEGEEFEENILFSNDVLLEKNAAVRIRRTTSGTTLTYKERVPNVSGTKQQVEYETEVADPGALETILRSIGLDKRVIYEKRRQTYRFRQVEVVLDELPFGDFMEIEGSITAIAEAEMLLGIESLHVEHETYPRLTARLGTRNAGVAEARFGDDRPTFVS